MFGRRFAIFGSSLPSSRNLFAPPGRVSMQRRLVALVLSCAALGGCSGEQPTALPRFAAAVGGHADVTLGPIPGGAVGGHAGAVGGHAGAVGGHAGAVGGHAGVGGAGGSPQLPMATASTCNGYTLLGGSQNSRLIDMAGNVVHSFEITGFPPKLLPGGSLIGGMGTLPGNYDYIEMRQVSWIGELEWSFSNWVGLADGTSAARQHHDFQRQGNPVGYYAPGQHFVEQGNTLVLAHAIRSAGELRQGTLDDDVLYELDWAGKATGFFWYGVNHFDEFGFDEAARRDIRSRAAGTSLEWLHGNSMSLLGPNRWFDEGRAEFHPDNIIYSSRQANFVIIISRDTGVVVWRIGPEFAGRPEEALGQFAGQHHAHMIPKGLPGAGNVLVFDNGGSSGYGGPEFSNKYERAYSRVLEFNPVTLEMVWQYGAPSGPEYFYSSILSGVQRLPNGNTLITIGLEARVIEVGPDGGIVWEYRNGTPTESANWLYRSYRIPPEWLPDGVNATYGNYPTWGAMFE
jgi:hypothetical protein